ncbi:3D domain-containing protein [Clostridium sp. Marseille-P2415]|uniref:3D domain-containing protein n=1 Tax=Clostridium sp. Marseille-P2415 TaxID=1805471 RepID=UPI00098858F5|nr:3D domain-containing protein [Clostridium sp. Marseille-P2415]
MKRFSGHKRITGFLTLLCILLLSSTAMAAETTENKQTAAEAQSGSVGTDDRIIKNSSGNVATSSNAEMPSEEIGPGIRKTAEPEKTEPAGPVYEKGESLGFFNATAYCPNSESSGRQSRTYSGTIPRPQHTISADITILPLGTKVMIDGIVYTVEDIGGSVKGKKIDIFFSSRAEALAFGRQTKELFAVVES